MSLSFEFNKAALTPLPLGVSADAADGVSTARLRVWEGIPFALHRALNGGKSGQPTAIAALLYGADRALRGLMYLIAVGISSYLFSFNYVFSAPIDAGRDWFVWLVLVCWYLTLLLQLFGSLFGRYRPHPETLSVNEYLDNEELQLPALAWNYQVFGTNRARGWIAAGIVTILLLTNAVAWGATITAAASRMLAQDPFSSIYTVVWVAVTLQHVLSALARSVSFAELRASTRKESDPPNAIERARVVLISVYISWVVCIHLPLSLFGLLYVGS